MNVYVLSNRVLKDLKRKLINFKEISYGLEESICNIYNWKDKFLEFKEFLRINKKKIDSLRVKIWRVIF